MLNNESGTKKSYQSPKLTLYGDICELTQNSSVGSGPDSGCPTFTNRSIITGTTPPCPT